MTANSEMQNMFSDFTQTPLMHHFPPTIFFTYPITKYMTQSSCLLRLGGVCSRLVF